MKHVFGNVIYKEDEKKYVDRKYVGNTHFHSSKILLIINLSRSDFP